MAGLVLGPLLRYAGETEATIWVETDAPCEVEVAGARQRTFAVEGHHYALVHCTGLEPASTLEYEATRNPETVSTPVSASRSRSSSSIRTTAGRPLAIVRAPA